MGDVGGYLWKPLVNLNLKNVINVLIVTVVIYQNTFIYFICFLTWWFGVMRKTMRLSSKPRWNNW